MAKLKETKGKMEEGKTKTRGTSKNVSVDTNEESTGTISKKHFGHVLSTSGKLHGGDPYKASHKL